MGPLAALLRWGVTVSDWLAGLDGRLVRGNYLYADGGTHVRVSAAADALATRLTDVRPDTALAGRHRPSRRAAGVLPRRPRRPERARWREPRTRAAFTGAHRFGVEIFESDTANNLMAALLVHDLSTERQAVAHAWQDEACAAVHGGLWRAASEPRSGLGLAAVLGYASART